MNANNVKSTVAFKSNLQPIVKSIRTDSQFLSSIHDPFALEIMGKLGVNAITPIQKKEYRDAALHCVYAYKDDYPWGTILDSDGIQKVVCKCINTECSYFDRCRPDFDVVELDELEKNAHFEKQINEIIDSVDERKNDDVLLDDSKDDEALKAIIFAEPKLEENAKAEELINTENEFPDLVRAEEACSVEDKLNNVSFDSFEEVKQEDIVMLPSQERTVVNAGPGTGKTWTLIEKIKYMLSVEGVEPENILVLCFSRSAVEVIRTRLEQSAEVDELPLNWHELDVRTFDSFATFLLAWIQENKPDILPDYFSLEFADYEQRINAAISVVSKFDDLLAEYKHLIVDEVQDLVGSRAELVLSLLANLPDTCGFTILGDSCQSLYDYLSVNDDSVMNSTMFYDNIFRKYKSANYFSLTHNYRQGDEFGNVVIPYRNAILTGSSEERAVEARRLKESINVSSVNLKRFTISDALKYQKKGTLGILTRTNGQALQISSWLHSEGVNHILQKPLNVQSLAAWVGKVIMKAETDVIDKQEFVEIFEKSYPQKAKSAERYWNALISTQSNQTKRHYEIEEILRGLILNARNPLLFEEPLENEPSITISNIHRAKGKEFDSVLVLGDVLEALTEDENDDILEHKVCYVALTRPKKEVETANYSKQYIYISKDEIRRCFKSGGRPGHNYLSHFEIGDSTDVNMRSFASSKQIQDYIPKLPIDTRLLFIRCPEGSASYVVYKIVPEEEEGMVLGYTTPEFARNIEKAIQRIYKNWRTVSYSYYPEILSDVYISGLNTCVSASSSQIEGAKAYGSMYIWHGLDVSGFAHRESTRY